MTCLGILALANGGQYIGEHPDDAPGITEQRRYESPPIVRVIPGAWASNVVAGDPALEDDYVQAAQELERAGADAITTSCGFTVRYQQAIAAAVSVPVSTSSLLLLPSLLSIVPPSKKIAVLTADSRCLDGGIMKTLGIADPSRLIVEGLEGTNTYAFMWAEDGKIDVSDVIADTDKIIARVQQHEDVAAILCECTIYTRTAARIRRATGLPVYDAASNVSLLMAAVG